MFNNIINQYLNLENESKPKPKQSTKFKPIT